MHHRITRTSNNSNTSETVEVTIINIAEVYTLVQLMIINIKTHKVILISSSSFLQFLIWVEIASQGEFNKYPAPPASSNLLLPQKIIQGGKTDQSAFSNY